MIDKTYVFHEDPGHGWLAVPIKELFILGIANKISNFTYVNGNTAYLEEDCDAGEFVKAFKEKFGVAPKYRVAYKEYTPIRGYDRYEYKEVA